MTHPVSNPVQPVLHEMRTQAHANCVVCSSSNERGLQVQFVKHGSSGVQAQFDCGARFEGYAGMLHGGVTASLIDGAMTQCMFALGVSAVTAELTVRFCQPVLTGKVATVRAWIERSSPRLYLVKAKVVQGGQTRVVASGKFVKRNTLARSELPRD